MARRIARAAEIIAAFDAGEKDCAKLGRLFGATGPGVSYMLRRNGRVPRSKSEANRSAEMRAIKSDAQRGKTLPPERVAQMRRQRAARNRAFKAKFNIGLNAVTSAGIDRDWDTQ